MRYCIVIIVIGFILTSCVTESDPELPPEYVFWHFNTTDYFNLSVSVRQWNHTYVDTLAVIADSFYLDLSVLQTRGQVRFSVRDQNDSIMLASTFLEDDRLTRTLYRRPYRTIVECWNFTGRIDLRLYKKGG
jgi:hypothetical protein